jgi:hypothetical protein
MTIQPCGRRFAPAISACLARDSPDYLWRKLVQSNTSSEPQFRRTEKSCGANFQVGGLTIRVTDWRKKGKVIGDFSECLVVLVFGFVEPPPLIFSVATPFANHAFSEKPVGFPQTKFVTWLLCIPRSFHENDEKYEKYPIRPKPS